MGYIIKVGDFYVQLNEEYSSVDYTKNPSEATEFESLSKLVDVAEERKIFGYEPRKKSMELN